MRVSFKPTSIKLPEQNTFYMKSPKCSPSVNFQLNPFEEQVLKSNKNKIDIKEYPKTPYPQDTNPMENNNFNTSIDEISSINYSQFNEMVSNINSTLVIDIRPAMLYAKVHVKGSINIFMSSTLLKQNSFQFSDIINSIMNPKQRTILNNWKRYQNIIFMDTNSTVISNDSTFHKISKRLTDSSTQIKFFWLKGGFKELQLHSPSLLSTNTTPLISTLKKPSLSLNSLGPLTISQPCDQQFFNCLRQYNTASCSTEKIPIQMPSMGFDFSKNNRTSGLPSFLQKMIEDDHGDKAMAELFEKLDLSEQKRLRSISKNCDSSNPYSVSAGIEKGHKNRYMNIWPYECTRIKLEQYEEGESDYINASLIKEPITQKEYIATQGPLPATFQDFWQLIWQSYSRLIIMLTKEFEGGRIRCHRYWPDTVGEVKTCGKYQIKFLQEEGCANTGLIFLRKFLLTKTDSLEGPRVIVQLHYIGWPDFGVPSEPTTLLRVRNLARHLQTLAESTFSKTGPMVVHCSAGCGRTGAFCSVDSSIYALDVGLASNYSDIVYKIIESFREQRISMVQTHRQLVLCYESLIWYLLSDRRCGELSGLCPNLRHIDYSPLEVTTPSMETTDSYFTPATIPSGGDYFSIPTNSIAGYTTPKADGFPF